jgi:methionyl-tRNA formyltransferase
MDLRVVFMGSPDFSLSSLESLARHYSVAGVVTQPDRPAGRGRVLTPPPIKVLAQDLGIETIQPQRLKEPEAQAKLHEWQPDLIVVTAFGQILRQNVLDLPRFGCINVHASLLPRWRGAAPIQAAILHGDAVTGVTIMKMDAGIDTGPWLARREEGIHSADTTESLSARLAHLGAELLIETLPGYLDGSIQPQKQDDEHATYASMIEKEAGHLDFSRPAEELSRCVRAYTPWPGTYTMVRGELLKVRRAHALEEKPAVNADSPQGLTAVIEGLPAVVTAQGLLVLDEVQPSGKKPMPGQVFLNGFREWGRIQL